ncbi:MAG TPA: isochorismatase family cysteine hydrolase [Nitrososphaerales archaeon]|nr:isochorismatase family cysteine hydrolase [Nitrososphaerales archaeon]
MESIEEEFWNKSELIRPRHTAIIVIDMQNDTCKQDSPLGRAGWDMSSVAGMAPRLANFLTATRKLGFKVIHTRNIHSSNTNSGVRLRQARKSKWPIFAEASTTGSAWYDKFSEFNPLPGEAIITKHRYSAFVGTDLTQVLRANSIRTLALTGVETHVCVESTARSAFMEDFHVLLISDCTATQTAPNQKVASEIMRNVTLDIIDEYFGTVMTSDEFLLLAMQTKTLA